MQLADEFEAGAFGFGEVAGGVGGPEGAVVVGGGAGAEAAAAEAEPAAGGAGAGHAGLALFGAEAADAADVGEGGGAGLILAVPDLGEGGLFDVAEHDVLPELVGVDIPLGVDVGDAASRAVGAAAIPCEKASGFFEVGVVFALHAEEEVGAIGRLGDGEEFAVDALGMPGFDTGDEGIESVTGFLGGEYLQGAAAAAGDEVIEADALDLFLLDEVEDAVDVFDVVAGEGEAEAGFLAGFMTGVKATDGGVEGAFFAAKFVVDFADAIERDADVGDLRGFEAGGFFGSDEGAVGGDGQFEALGGGEIDEVEEAGVDEGLATGEEK